jgi:FixJ family two-component response regulator
MISHLFVFEPNPELVRKIMPVWEHHFMMHAIPDFQAMESALLSENAGSAVIVFHWDRWTSPLQLLQKIRVWHRLIPIVVVATRIPHDFCLAALREQVYTFLNHPFVPEKVWPVLDAIFDDYDMLSLRNMYYLSLRQRKFVFNKTLRYQEFQLLAREIATRAPWNGGLPVPVAAFVSPKPVILVLDLTSGPIGESLPESRYTVRIAADVSTALHIAVTTPDIAMVIFDVAVSGAAEACFLTALGAALPKAAILVWTASQDIAVAMQCFQIGVFDYINHRSTDVALSSHVETMLQMKGEMEAGGDIALHTRQDLFAHHCQQAFQQGKPVLWSDWYLFFKRGFPENTSRMAADNPISHAIFTRLGVSGLSVLAPDPVDYPDAFVGG